jgi:hypothetical protein
MPNFPPPCFTLRSRREVNTRDQVNSLHVEQWQTDGPWLQNDRPDISGQRYFMDMNPISSRKSIQNEGQDQQPQFYPDINRQPLKKTGVDQPITVPKQNPGLINNPYLQRLDAVNDARNIPREMRSAVYEDNRERDLDSTRLLAERQFTYRYIPEDESAKLASIQAYELLRPKTDDYTKQYQH